MPRSAIDQQLDEKTQYTLGAQDVAQMAHDLFHAMLGMQINPEPTESFGASKATIQIAGDWNAECYIQVCDELAQRIAGAMFDAAPENLSDEEIFDAMGETVNVIGGNAKGMIDQDCSLSLPSMGRSINEYVEGSLSLAFDCEGFLLTLMVIER
jgi:hypothetical protein